MLLEPITDWQMHIAAGRQYLHTAVKGRRRRAVFNNELVFQLAAMAVEKLIVGLVQYHQQMPADHTLSGLAAGLTQVSPLDTALTKRIERIEAVDDMCALTVERRPPPQDADIEEILAVGRELALLVEGYLPQGCGTSRDA